MKTIVDRLSKVRNPSASLPSSHSTADLKAYLSRCWAIRQTDIPRREFSCENKNFLHRIDPALWSVHSSLNLTAHTEIQTSSIWKLMHQIKQPFKWMFESSLWFSICSQSISKMQSSVSALSSLPLSFNCSSLLPATVFSEDEALVLHVILAPAEFGTITVYLPVVLDLSRLEWVILSEFALHNQ